MKPVDLMMFDFDGTLADTGEDIAASVNHALRALGLGSSRLTSFSALSATACGF